MRRGCGRRRILLSEFLVKFAPEFRPEFAAGGKMMVHGHCHHRAGAGMADEMTVLRRTGAEVKLLDSGCCGMAGPFGFEADKFEISQTLGERVLLPAVRAAARGVGGDGRLQLRGTDYAEHECAAAASGGGAGDGGTERRRLRE